MSERKLFAVAAEKQVSPNQWVPEIVHLHATDSANARFIFLQDPNHRKFYRIVAVGPVIGYHVEDEHGERLRA